VIGALLLVAAAATSAPAAEPLPTATGSWPDATTAAARAACDGLLKGRTIEATPLPPIGGPDSCGAPAPVRVTRVAGVAIVPPATLTCTMAAELSDWITGSLQPIAARDLGTRVTAIHDASDYVCRTRNHIAGAKISEHAKANALDMASFDYAAKVAPGWAQWLGPNGKPAKGSFVAHVRDGACLTFTTVLGPGSDVYHGDHFHLDILARKGGYRICQ
jgi:hypothetical protein